MHPNAQTLTRFYTAFAELDADAMGSCYSLDATFDDPAFSLKGQHEIAGMWHMLCNAARGNGKQDWRLDFNNLQANDSSGHVHWEARYRFTATRRQVHNIVEADFTFCPEGLIASHRDQFDFWRWSRQALGMGGWVLGWAPFFNTQMRRQTRAALDSHLAKNV
ncbi:nuclear transport factor 2 family protein [Rhodoferax antarcticus]|uniref:SnoaL-like domain-containing protein n=1 Tax=Rhodoferax antarcticus ANT.BR TaxID=1111071 RepID=A0A1Q8YJA1_9BURK|nr:nuclear transport factor 2 family protein [Rhodoferax antarcticus]APW47810.1 ketosteroid isomerase [Rhodoferax antarcticus]MCW2312352.1 putative secreted protein [Rhodoferax antarcticus]OLP08037.1 hypothetical protein BLL52_0663 [Rhodoferax antarcticus ANT.BR]